MKKAVVLLLLLLSIPLAANDNTVTGENISAENIYLADNTLSVKIDNELWYPFQGDKAISQSEFFDLVGDRNMAGIAAQMEEKADRQQSAANVVKSIGTFTEKTGIALITAGVFGMIFGWDRMIQDDRSQLMGIGMVLTGSGAALWGTGWLIEHIGITMNPKPEERSVSVSANFILDHVDRYNADLKK